MTAVTVPIPVYATPNMFRWKIVGQKDPTGIPLSRFVAQGNLARGMLWAIAETVMQHGSGGRIHEYHQRQQPFWALPCIVGTFLSRLYSISCLMLHLQIPGQDWPSKRCFSTICQDFCSIVGAIMTVEVPRLLDEVSYRIVYLLHLADILKRSFVTALSIGILVPMTTRLGLSGSKTRV